MNVKIVPSLLSADFACLAKQVEEAIAAGADLIHVDIMDGHFVPNMSLGPQVVSALEPITRPAGVPMDVHLMIERPENMIPAFARAGAGYLTVHVETCPHLHRTLQLIRELGVRPAVTLNPGTPLCSLEEALTEVDMVLVMGVNPGFGGQSYIPATTGRVRRLRRMLDERGLAQVDIQVDGGVKVDNARLIAQAGANVLVAGSAIFNKERTVAENMAAFRQAVSGL